MADIFIRSVLGLRPALVEVDRAEVIRVRGESSGCEYIRVTVHCGDQSATTVVQSTRRGRPEDNLLDTWLADVPNPGCSCSKRIFVVAKCDANAMGNIVDEDTRDELLDCEGGCPRTGLNVFVGDCGPARFRRVEYSIAFDPPLPPGTTGQVSWAYGGSNAANATISQEAIDTGKTSLESLTHVTALAPAPQPYASAVTVALQVPGTPGLCFATHPAEVPVFSCLPCPNEDAPVTLAIAVPSGPEWCAPTTGPGPVFTATLNWPANLPNPPAPSSYSWTVSRPDGTSATQIGPAASVSASAGWRGALAVGNPGPISLTAAGTYAVAVAANFPPGAGLPTDADGTPSCNLQDAGSFVLSGCAGDAPCPSLTAIQVDAGCFDGSAADVTFTATISDPRLLGGMLTWDFGDGSGTTTGAPSVVHSYASSGQFTATVTIGSGTACQSSGPSSASAAFSIAPCGGSGDDGGASEGSGCTLLRLAGMFLLAAALGSAIVATCVAAAVPPLFVPLLIVAGVTAVLGAALLVAWTQLCPQPCLWGLLLTGQILVAAGYLAICFGFCCPWVWIVGVALVIIGILLLLAWRDACGLDWCRFWKELAYPLLAFVGPALLVLALIPILAGCSLAWVVALLDFFTSVIALTALICEDS